MKGNYKEWALIRQSNEERVIEILENKANFQGWKTICKNVGQGKQGIDLKLEKDNSIIVVEAKGEREGPPQHSSEVKGALGEIIMDMKGENLNRICCYCIAFPDTPSFQSIVNDIPVTPRQKLNLTVILVDCSAGQIGVRQPDSQREVKFSTFDSLLEPTPK